MTAISYGNYTNNKSSSIAGLTSVLTEFTTSTAQSLIKYHQTLAQSISNNICKAFPDFSKLNRKRIHLMMAQVLSTHDDLKRAILIHVKNVENYYKLVKVTEDYVLACKENSSDTTESSDKKVDNGRMSLDGLRTDAVANSASKSLVVHTAKKDESFINRSLSRMANKLYLSSDSRNNDEKIFDFLKEIDLTVSQLTANERRLIDCKQGLLTEVKNTLQEVCEIEVGRFSMLLVGLNKIASGVDSLSNKSSDILKALSFKLVDVNLENEILSILKGKVSSCLQLGFINISSLSVESQELLGQVSKLASQVEGFIDIYDSSLSIVQFWHQIFTIQSDIEKYRSRTIQKVLEKYTVPFTDTNESSIEKSLASQRGPFLCINDDSSEVHYIRKVLVRLVLLYVKIADTSKEMCESCETILLEKLNVVSKEIQAYRRVIKEKYLLLLKNLEILYGQLSKTSQKLLKVRSTIHERSSTLINLKASLGDKASSKPNQDSISNGEDLGNKSDVEFNSVETKNSSVKTSTPKKSAIDSISSSMRNSKMKQVVGLESALDRANRIESQLVGLEAEKNELVTTLETNTKNLEGFLKNENIELSIVIMDAKNKLVNELQIVKDSVASFFEWKEEKATLIKQQSSILIAGSTQESLLSIYSEDSFTESERTQDRQVHSILSTFNIENTKDNFIFKVPVIDTLKVIKSELLEEERSRLKRVLNINGNGFGESSPNPISYLKVSEKEESAPFSPSVETISTNSGFLNAHNDSNEDERDGEGLQEQELQTISSTMKASISHHSMMDSEEVNVETKFSQMNDLRQSSASSTDSNVVEQTNIGAVKNVNENDQSSMRLAQSPNKVHLQSGPLNNNLYENELRKFGLDSSDKVIESFSSAIYPKKGILTHGRSV